MKKWQTLKDSQGNECILFPMDYMKITQGNNGQYSHQGVNALDIAGKDAGIDEVYCPVSLKYMWSDTAKNGNALFLESIAPVKWADGTLDYASFMIIHDNYIGDIISLANKGHIFKQGEPISDEGVSGLATGNHSHIEGKKGKLQWNKYKNPQGGGLGYYQINAQGIYQLQDSIPSDKIFFIDGTILYNNGQTIDSGNKMNWKAFKDLKIFSEEDLIPEHGIATLTEDQIRARLDSPTGKVLRTYKKGSKIEYTHKYIGNGHRYISWKENGKIVLLAVSGSEKRGVESWATFSDIEEKPKPKPVEDYIHGIDISESNSNVKYKDNDFVLMRASFGEHDDILFKKHLTECQKLKIPVGVYHMAYAINEKQAYDEINYFLDATEDVDVKFGYWLDLEETTYWGDRGLNTPEHFTMVAKVWDKIMTEKGLYHGIYSGKYWFDNFIKVPVKNKWIANWGNDDAIRDDDLSDICVIHQYTSNHNTLDENVCYVDPKTFLNATPSKKDEDEKEEKLNIGALNELTDKLLDILK